RLTVHQQVPGPTTAEVAALYDRCGVTHQLAPFFNDVPQRLAAAHLVISRAGASTVAELAAAGRPAVMVPYPSATDDHQTANAQALVEAGGGWLMPQANLDAAGLAERLAALLDSPTTLARAAGCARAAAHLDAARDLADLVCGASNGNGQTLAGNDKNKEAAA
ncbi:MAG: glycosyltransferase, partial [Kiloniellaceae bacterium]